MKNFKDVWEDAAANSVAGGGVSLPADAVKPKRKKSVYDGRTKEGRKFVERMVARKKARKDAEEKKLYAQNMKSVSVKEESIEEKVTLKGQDIFGLKDNKGKPHTAKAVLVSGKLGYRVTNQFGDFETLNLKAFAKKFG
jgi:hypothetical protein|tara:strand:+ start:950 stop:1366 length:417 start_codon:yes stop_codon:yes gene_type:complete